MNIKDTINKLFKRFGYITEKYHSLEMSKKDLIIRRKNNELKALKAAALGDLVTAIRQVKMVKVMSDMRGFSEIAAAGEIVSAPTFNTRQPPQSNWYAITTKVDFGIMQRIHEDAQLKHNSIELDMFTESILYEIKSNMHALMRINQYD